jgi:hypothetical protein
MFGVWGKMTDDHELIDRIYEAAIIPENWSSILEEISTIAGCYGGCLFSMDAQQEVKHIATEQYRDLMHIFVRDGWTKQNIRAERLAKIKYPGFVTDGDVISVEEMNVHPFYTELLRLSLTTLTPHSALPSSAWRTFTMRELAAVYSSPSTMLVGGQALNS